MQNFPKNRKNCDKETHWSPELESDLFEKMASSGSLHPLGTALNAFLDPNELCRLL